MLQITPEDGDVAYLLGLFSYQTADDSSTLDEALSWFRSAVTWSPNHQMAKLHLAHCFHDLREWANAAAAYKTVDLHALASRWPCWRALKAQEQLAACLAFSGQLDDAIREFTAVFDKIDSLNEAQLSDHVMNLDESVDALSGPLKSAGLARRVNQIIARMELADRYPNWALAREGEDRSETAKDGAG